MSDKASMNEMPLIDPAEAKLLSLLKPGEPAAVPGRVRAGAPAAK